jgi:hypothetical protein
LKKVAAQISKDAQQHRRGRRFKPSAVRSGGNFTEFIDIFKENEIDHITGNRRDVG